MRIVLIHLGFLGYILTLPSCSLSPDKATVSEQANGTWSFEMGSARLLVDPKDGTKDVLPMNIMPGEQDVEIYVDSRFDYIEIEVLSEKTKLEPGDSLEWQVEWRILKIPADMDISTGNQGLPALIQSSLK